MSPRISLVQSYAGKTVATMVSLPLSFISFPEQPDKPSVVVQIIKTSAENKAIYFCFTNVLFSFPDFRIKLSVFYRHLSNKYITKTAFSQSLPYFSFAYQSLLPLRLRCAKPPPSWEKGKVSPVCKMRGDAV